MPRPIPNLRSALASIPEISEPGPWQVLLVEDNEAHVEILKRAFESRGSTFQVTAAASVAESLALLQQRTFSLVISDWELPLSL